jgi:His/Glu/Gln/Arg/opine family amino acid ABC transporter permease subunit
VTVSADVVIQNLPYLMRGLRLTAVITLVCMVASLAVGVVLALLRRSTVRALGVVATVYIETLRSTPLLMVIFWFYFLLPLLTGKSLEPLVTGIVAMVAFQSAYVAEIVRAGITSVKAGQLEAAMALGLSYRGAMWRVVLPQAFRNMLPALVARFVALFKSTSLLYVIGVVEFFRAATIVNSREFRPMEIFLFVAFVYLCCGVAASVIGAWLERTMATEDLRLEASSAA